MTKTIDVAVIGASGAVGEAVFQFLAEREFPVGRIHALASDRSLGRKVDFGGRELPVETLDGFDFAKIALAFFAAGADITTEYAPRAVAAGVSVIDLSGASNADPAVPLVVPEINSDDLEDFAAPGVVASPAAVAVALALALKPLTDAAGLERVEVATYQAVSAAGKDALEELARQTAALLNLQPVKPARFPRQIAFNLIPQVGEFTDNGYTTEEMAITTETRRLLGQADLPVSATCVRVPVFYGHSMAVRVELGKKLSAEAARKLLKKSPGIQVLDVRKPGGYPTPVTDASQNDEVFVGRIREDISHPRGLNFWIAADNVRKGAALNGVQIAELLLRDHL